MFSQSIQVVIVLSCLIPPTNYLMLRKYMNRRFLPWRQSTVPVKPL